MLRWIVLEQFDLLVHLKHYQNLIVSSFSPPDAVKERERITGGCCLKKNFTSFKLSVFRLLTSTRSIKIKSMSQLLSVTQVVTTVCIKHVTS